MQKQEGIRVEVKNRIREMMMFHERLKEYSINRITSGKWDNNLNKMVLTRVLKLIW